jgi:hypothetical protein
LNETTNTDVPTEAEPSPILTALRPLNVPRSVTVDVTAESNPVPRVSSTSTSAATSTATTPKLVEKKLDFTVETFHLNKCIEYIQNYFLTQPFDDSLHDITVVNTFLNPLKEQWNMYDIYNEGYVSLKILQRYLWVKETGNELDAFPSTVDNSIINNAQTLLETLRGETDESESDSEVDSSDDEVSAVPSPRDLNGVTFWTFLNHSLHESAYSGIKVPIPKQAFAKPDMSRKH